MGPYNQRTVVSLAVFVLPGKMRCKLVPGDSTAVQAGIDGALKLVLGSSRQLNRHARRSTLYML